MKYENIYDSSKSVYEKEFEIDYENDKSLTVFFEKEDIVLLADAHGNAVFTNKNENEIKKIRRRAIVFSAVFTAR